MKTRRTTLLTGLMAAMLLAAVPFWSSCGSSGSAPAAAPTPVIDLAVGSRNSQWIHVWMDALQGAGLGSTPAIALDTSQYRGTNERVRYVRIVGEQLFAISSQNNSNGAVLIWNDFRNIVGNQAPDVVLDANSGFDHPNYMAIHNNDLYVSSVNNSRVCVFRDVTTLATSDTPDVILTDGIRFPNCVLVTDTALYVTNAGYHRNDGELDNVVVFNDPASLVTGAAPDVTLGNPPAAQANGLLAGSQFAGVKHCFLEGNTLYVTCVRRGTGHANGVWSFSPADALTDYQAPDFIVGGPAFDNYPMCVRDAGGRLWVGTTDYETGVVGFDYPLYTGKLPDVELMEENNNNDNLVAPPWTPEQGRFTFIPGDVKEIVSVGGVLIGVSERDDAVFGYLDPGTVVTNQAPDFILWYPGMDDPDTIHAVQR